MDDPLDVLDGRDALDPLDAIEGRGGCEVDPLDAVKAVKTLDPLKAVGSESASETEEESESPTPLDCLDSLESLKLPKGRCRVAETVSTPVVPFAVQPLAVQPLPKQKPKKHTPRQILDAHLCVTTALLPQRIAHSHVSTVIEHILSRVGEAPSLEDSRLQHVGDLFTPEFLRQALLHCADVYLTSAKVALQTIRSMGGALASHDPVSGDNSYFVVGSTAWDETEQNLSLNRSMGVSVDGSIPLDPHYLAAKRLGLSTAGMPMQTCNQESRLCVSTMSGAVLVDETSVAPLTHLLRLQAEHLWNNLSRYMPFSPLLPSPFIASARCLLAVLIFACDRASNNNKMLRFVLYYKLAKLLMILSMCLSHIVHGCSNGQAAILDDDVRSCFVEDRAPGPAPLEAPPFEDDAAAAAALEAPPLEDDAAAAAAPAAPEAAAAGQDRGRGRGGKGRGGGRGGRGRSEGKGKGGRGRGGDQGRGKGAAPKRTVAPTLLSSLVRGVHIVTSGNTWQTMVQRFERFVDSRNVRLLSLHDMETMPPGDQATLERNFRKNEVLAQALCGWSEADTTAPKLSRRTKSSIMFLDIFGWSDWEDPAADVIILPQNTVHTAAEAKQCLRVYGRDVFFASRPPLPAQGRWTGLLGAACFFGRLLMFGNMLAILLVRDLGAEAAEVADAAVALLCDGDAYRMLAGARLKSFLKNWVQLPRRRALLQVFLLVTQNLPLRRILLFIFKYEGKSGLPPSPEELESVRARYALPPDTEETPYDAPWLEWCRNRKVVQAASELGGSLKDDGKLFSHLALLFSDADGNLSDDTLTLARSVAIKGHAELRARLDCDRKFPEHFCRYAHPDLDAEGRRHAYLTTMFATTFFCCWDRGFTRQRLDQLAGTSLAQVLKEEDDETSERYQGITRGLVDTLTQPQNVQNSYKIAKEVRMSIFNMECAHRDAQKDIAASSALGRPKDILTVSAGRVLSVAKRLHSQALRGVGGPRPGRVTRTGRKAKRRRQALGQLLGKRRSFKTNGFFLFKAEQQRRSALAGLGNLVGVREAVVRARWGALDNADRAFWSRQARTRNSDARIAAPAPATAIAPAVDSVKLPWNLGDREQALVGANLLEAHLEHGACRTDARERFKVHMDQGEVDPGLQAQMQRASAHKDLLRTCYDIGLCKWRFRSSWHLICAVHALLKRMLVTRLGITKTQLKGASVLLCLHGWRPGSEHQHQFVLLIAWQSLKPRRSLFLRVTRDTQLPVRPEMRDDCNLATLLPDQVAWKYSGDSPPEDSILDLETSMSMVSRVVALTEDGDMRWSLAVLRHTPIRLSAARICGVGDVHLLWPRALAPRDDDPDEGPDGNGEEAPEALDEDFDPLGVVQDASGSESELDLADVRVELTAEAVVDAQQRVQRRRSKAAPPAPPHPIAPAPVPIAAPWKLSKQKVWLEGRVQPCGTIKLMDHWVPPKWHAACWTHRSSACTATAGLEHHDVLCEWLAKGPAFADEFERHRQCRPDL